MDKTDSLLAAFPQPALVLDTARDLVVDWNPEAARLLAGSTDAKPKPFSRYLGKALSQFVVFLDEVDHRGTGWTRDVILTGPGGHGLKCELMARPVTGKPGWIMLSLADLTELERRAEQAAAAETFRAGLIEWKRTETFFAELERQNQLILNAAGEGIYGVNAEGKTTFVNRAAQDMLGWTIEDLLGKDIHSMIHHHHLNGEVYPSHDCPIYRSFRFEQVNRIEDEVFWRKDGKPIRVEYVSTPIYDQQILAGAVVIFRDITERKENERKLRDALSEVAALRDRLEQENAYLQEAISTARAHHDIIGVSPAIRQTITRIDLVAKTEATVLISGETGTGKSLVAAAIHKASPRARRPLIHFKCSSVSPEQVEAELFGQVRGAPNGATRDKAGKLELAHGGTLFLDDVEELPFEIQGKLLAALQTKAVTRIGDTREKPLDIRVIASTALSDAQARRSTTLREDLHLFLNVFPIACVPLRDRQEDIPLLAVHLLKLACARLNRPEPVLTEGVVQQLQAYEWPGNVRELHNVMERAAIVSQDRKLVVEMAGAAPEQSASTAFRTEAQMQALARENTLAALRETGGRVSGSTGAAALLGIKPTTLYSRLRTMQISKEEWT
ncbi:sigma 54-interacting transcriptional regulator [Cognatishimia sp. F0-27]|uniref:sigma 54-interacting transcriptional regulator n=1 Tax=Cognatishimia sp. F0-27 TaxID=2816855 RepID=UPI001D0C4895|nr:sigma 54-interacting transcriptional regulator [Cognatishimia sp. F0-27]MCC1493834.1 sigma 54-interacting transcriptional regulator [Cognatishimia sp. F0-27]